MKKVYKYIDLQNLYRNIGMNIKFYRKELEITQSDLADITGLSHEYVRKIEANSGTKCLSIGALNSIAIALEVNIEDLVKPNAKTIDENLF